MLCFLCVCVCVYVFVFLFVIDGVTLNGSFLGCVIVVLVCAGVCVLF